MKRYIFLLTGLCVFAGALRPAENEKGTSASIGFNKLKSLAGAWEATTKDGKAQLSYELVSGGNAVLERETMTGMPPMVTVYYLDGNRVLLTHYCMAGNQPRMQATAYDVNRNEMDFDFLDATNLADAKAGHMHSAKIHFIDNQHVASEWVFFENGAPKMTESAEYTRIK